MRMEPRILPCRVLSQVFSEKGEKSCTRIYKTAVFRIVMDFYLDIIFFFSTDNTGNITVQYRLVVKTRVVDNITNS